MSLFYSDGPCPWCKSQKLHLLSRQRIEHARGVMSATCVECQRVWPLDGQDRPTASDGAAVAVGHEKGEHLSAIQSLLSWLTATGGRTSITFTRKPRGSHAERS